MTTTNNIPSAQLRITGKASDYPQTIRVSIDGTAVVDLEVELALDDTATDGGEGDDVGPVNGAKEGGEADRDSMPSLSAMRAQWASRKRRAGVQ